MAHRSLRLLVLVLASGCVSAAGFPSFILFAGTIFALSDPGVATPTGPPGWVSAAHFPLSALFAGTILALPHLGVATHTEFPDCADMGILYFMKNKNEIHVKLSNTINVEVVNVMDFNSGLVCELMNNILNTRKSPNSCRYLNDTLMFSSEVGHNYTIEFEYGKTEKCVLTFNSTPQVDLQNKVTSQTSSTASPPPTGSSPGPPTESSPGPPTELKWSHGDIGIAVVVALVLGLAVVLALKYFMGRRNQNRPHADPEIPEEESLQMQVTADDAHNETSV